MTYELLKFAHLIGLALIAGGLIGVWIFDIRSRQLIDLPLFAEAVRNIAVFYDGVVVPGALLLLASGTWMIASFYGGWAFLDTPWLVGMVLLFALEFVEGNTITRLYFMRLRRLTKGAGARDAGARARTAGREGPDFHAFSRHSAADGHHLAGRHPPDELDAVFRRRRRRARRRDGSHARHSAALSLGSGDRRERAALSSRSRIAIRWSFKHRRQALVAEGFDPRRSTRRCSSPRAAPMRRPSTRKSASAYFARRESAVSRAFPEG